MAYRANQQLRDDLWDYRYKFSQNPLPAEDDENVVNFVRQPAKHGQLDGAQPGAAGR